MKTISDSHFQKSKEFVKLNKLWTKTWKSLIINPFSKLLKDVDFDENDLYLLVKNYCEHHCEDVDQGFEANIKDIIKAYNFDDKTKKLLTYSFFNYVEYINDYLDSFNIMIVNTGRSEWDIIRYMDQFLGDIGSNKVCLWHERYDNESGEFVVFDKKFVEKCLVNNKFPELPRVEPSKEAKDLVKIITKENKTRQDNKVDVLEKLRENVFVCSLRQI
jgi:hypothetical protein